MKKIKQLKNLSNCRIFFYFIFFTIISCKPDNNLKDPLQAEWKGEKVCTILEENDKVRALKCTFPPGIGHEKHFHAAHFGYTLKGSKFKITDQTRIREVNVPDNFSFYNDKIKWHNVLNIGDFTAVFLIIKPK